ncbi:hypothetical protein B296_00054415 [Ensete ventricosum]|uniref:Uncharacterized protein n=1 Tax=Ensete ventricosum TaxID=4639 RepID=A0A426Y407_ENSVE|nr:hypothetical protein B296_00054415 [Ensete ventricosum]
MFVKSPSIFSGRDYGLNTPTCTGLVNGCPNLMSLALRGFKLHDHKVSILIKITYSISPMPNFRFYSIVMNMIFQTKMASLLTMTGTIDAIIHGNSVIFENLHALLISDVMKQRPEVCLLAKFPRGGRSLFLSLCLYVIQYIVCQRNFLLKTSFYIASIHIGSLVDANLLSDGQTSRGMSLTVMHNVAFDPYWTNMSENSYSSDQGSGNGGDSPYPIPFYDADSFYELEFPWEID